MAHPFKLGKQVHDRLDIQDLVGRRTFMDIRFLMEDLDDMPITSQAGKKSVWVYKTPRSMVMQVTISEQDTDWCMLCTGEVLVLAHLLMITAQKMFLVLGSGGHFKINFIISFLEIGP